MSQERLTKQVQLGTTTRKRPKADLKILECDVILTFNLEILDCDVILTINLEILDCVVILTFNLEILDCVVILTFNLDCSRRVFGRCEHHFKFW